MNIIAHSYISQKGAFLNGTKKVSCPADEERFLRFIYKSLEVNYPKFYKMDNLSKSAVLADFLMQSFYSELPNQEDKLQLIFANREASSKTDLSFIESFEPKENASPSLFVYTLPNIVTGELAIKNKWFGENTFFIFDSFDVEFFHEQITMSFNRGNQYCLCCWMEQDKDGKEECFLFLIGKSENDKLITDLKKIINTYRNE